MKTRLYLDPYIVTSLMPDLVRHDRQPSAYLVYLHLWGRTGGDPRVKVAASLNQLADDTGLSKRAVQAALATLERRRLLRAERTHATAMPQWSVLRPWRRGH